MSYNNSTSKNISKHALPAGRDLVVVSGYYGFDNLGDDAILEQLLAELDRAVGLDHVVVLSNTPEETEKTFSVKSANRWKLPAIAGLLKRSKLLVSGGGGLFQDSTSVKSVIYYSTIVCLARLVGARVAIYAQGVGPLKSQTGATLARLAFSQANGITVRDSSSLKLLESWNVSGELSADPVWCLEPKELPEGISNVLRAAKPGWQPLSKRGEATAAPPTAGDRRLVGLSVRPSRLRRRQGRRWRRSES
ncbi:MAG: polysaccharide pyruvyl transferase family protein [Cyanobacteria bacterium]|nr:polysaccharide pyruvyl transferase family protein [Cyanobacteriota bacterium]